LPPRPRRQLPITDPDELLAALGRLDERDRTVLKMRYGLAGERVHNLREIAKLLGISRERVRQLEARALDRLAELAGLTSTGGGTAGQAQVARGSGRPGAGSLRELIRRWTLLLLALGPAHVYELRRRFAELGLPPVSYRNLYELEQDGLVSSTWAPARKGGPDRRIYTLTGDGADRLQLDHRLLQNTAHTLADFLTRWERDGEGLQTQPDSRSR
jgi:DNA-binding PadR family transcriptional regulator/DNA-binding CsgD family transcriptional regulator